MSAHIDDGLDVIRVGAIKRMSTFVPVPNDIALRFDRGQWTPHTIDALRKLWDMNFSTAAMGDRLGFTKNAVVGKAHRIGLPGKPSPIIRDGRAPARIKVQRAAANTLPALASITTEPIIAVARSPVAAPRLSRAIRAPAPHLLGVAGIKPEPVPIERVRELAPVVLPMTGTCRWPLWANNEAPTHKYCDAPAKLGASWCADCRARVYTKVAA